MLRIKEAREARGWTQERLASEINTTQQTVQRWESGQTDPKSSTIKDISKALGHTNLSVDYAHYFAANAPAHMANARLLGDAVAAEM